MSFPAYEVERMLNVAREAERDRCIGIVLEQRSERGTPWDLAIVSAARALGSKIALPEMRYKTVPMTDQEILAKQGA